VPLPDGLALDGISILDELLMPVTKPSRSFFAENNITALASAAPWKKRPNNDTIFWGKCNMSPEGKQLSGIKKGRYKLIEDGKGKPAAMYDLWLDPFEDHNMLSASSESSQLQQVKGTLHAEMADYMEQPRVYERGYKK
jgi:hypothetical protein